MSQLKSLPVTASTSTFIFNIIEMSPKSFMKAFLFLLFCFLFSFVCVFDKNYFYFNDTGRSKMKASQQLQQQQIAFNVSSPAATAINPTVTQLAKCSPKSNIVFLKTHKCASSTIQNIFMRYGYANDKVFVLPSKNNYLGHPVPFHRSFVPSPKSFHHEYNILTHHSRFNYEEMRLLMPEDAKFVTIVRDPVDLFESMFNYYHLSRFWNVTLENIGNTTLQIPNKVLKDRFFGKIGRNQMLFDLGMDVTDFNNVEKVLNYIRKLDMIFDLVMVSEQMDESLILLKHLLCWRTDDVVVFKVCFYFFI